MSIVQWREKFNYPIEIPNTISPFLDFLPSTNTHFSECSFVGVLLISIQKYFDLEKHIQSIKFSDHEIAQNKELLEVWMRKTEIWGKENSTSNLYLNVQSSTALCNLFIHIDKLFVMIIEYWYGTQALERQREREKEGPHSGMNVNFLLFIECSALNPLCVIYRPQTV